MTIAEEKQAQRAAGRAARKALDAPQRAAANAALCLMKEGPDKAMNKFNG